MITSTSKSDLNASKRGACDRCRGQKLRCLRQDQSRDGPQDKCVRCFKAGAACSFGIPKRAGRPPGSHVPYPQERRRKSERMTSSPTVNTSDHSEFWDGKAHGGQDRRGAEGRDNGWLPQENAAGHESGEETQDTTPIHPLSPSSLHDTSNTLVGVNLDFTALSESLTASPAWSHETSLPIYNSDAGEASGLEALGPEYSWAFHHYQTQPMDYQRSTAFPISNGEQSEDVAVIAYESPALTRSSNTQILDTSDQAMDVEFPSKSAHVAPFNLIKTLDAQPSRGRDRRRVRPETAANMSLSSGAKSALFGEAPEKEPGIKSDEALSLNEAQHRRVHELSELAMDLYAQLAANDSQKHQSASSTTATDFQHQLVGNVLKSSNTFLMLLNSFSAPAPAPSPFPPPPRNPSVNHNDSNSTSSDSNSDAWPSESALEHDDSALDGSSLHPLHGNVSADRSADDSGRLPPPTDMPTVLQLLTCYIRIIHLHSIMYARMLDSTLAFLPDTTPQTDSVPPVFPGMQVGGVSLDQFGTFQVKLLLQISVHLLGEIELALGLPSGYQVGKRRGEKRRGVLETSVGEGFVESLMREGAWKGERERVEGTRQQLRRLKSVLKGT